MENSYDVCIIGSGPAGLFAADKLSKEGYKTAIIEKESYCSGGLFNDGKLNLSTEIGMDIDKLKLTKDEAMSYISYVDDMLVRFGADKKVYGTDKEKINYWEKKAKKYIVKLIPARQRHIGTDKSKGVIGEFRNHLINLGVDFYLNTNISDIYNIQTQNSNFYMESSNGEFTSKYLIAAPGRKGAYWFRDQANSLRVENDFGPIDVGLRIEMPNEIYDSITDVIYDPKFRYITNCHGDEVRTFCTNKGGRIRTEKNKKEDGLEEITLVNGDGLKDSKTNNTNMAILCTVNLTDPSVDTTELGRSIAIETLKAGGGIPIVQRVGDFKRGGRSKVDTFNDGIYSRLKPTLRVPKRAYHGDITHVYRARVIDNIREFLGVMDNIFPGFMASENLLYIPEIKFYDTDYPTTKNLETNLENLFVAGDGVGKSRGIIGAGLTGILAAEGIINKNG